MNKKFFLSVFLLGALTLSSGVLTSCIDNDEPEGITTLRSAKAELLRAKAALELAKAETEKQQALYVAAMAEHEKALAEVQKAEAEIKKAQAAVEAAKVAIVEAQADSLNAAAAKAWAEAEEAKSKAEKTIAENQAKIDSITLAAEKNKLELEKDIALAQHTLDQTLAEIEAAKAVLTGGQQAKLDGLKSAVITAWDNLAEAKKAVLTQMSNLFDATNDHADRVDSLQNDLIDAKANLIAQNAAYDELTTLYNSVSITAWEARRDSLRAYVGYDADSLDGGTHKVEGTAKVDSATLALKMLEIKQSAEYKAKDAEDAAAREAYVFAQMEYNFLSNGALTDGILTDCFEASGAHENKEDYTDDPYKNYGYYTDGTHPEKTWRTEAQTYAFAPYKIPVTNAKLIEKITTGSGAISLNSKNEIEFQGYGYNNIAKVDFKKFYGATFKSDDTNHNNFPISKQIGQWKDKLNSVGVTDEELAADSCRKEYQKEIEKKQKAHDEAVAAWKKAHKAYSEKKVEQTVSTATFAADIKKYNDNITALDAAVKAYNTAYDAAVAANEANIMQQVKDVVGLEAYKVFLTTPPLNEVFGIDASLLTQTSKAMLDSYVEGKGGDIASATLPDNLKTAAKVKAAGATKYAAAYGDNYSINEDTKIKEWAASKAVAGVTVGTYPLTGVFPDVAISTEVKAVNKTNVKALKDAYEAIKNTSTKPGILDKILAPAPSTQKDIEKGNYSNGSYNSIAVALGVFNDAAGKNCEKLKTDLATLEGNIPGYTGVKLKIVQVGPKDGSKYEVNSSDWVLDDVELDKDGNNYVENGHLRVVRTIVSEEAIAKMTAVEFDDVKATANWKSTSKTAFGTDLAHARHTELTADLVTKVGGNYYDENGESLPNYSVSTLKALVAAKEALAEHEALAGVTEALAELKEAVAKLETSLRAQIAEYTVPVQAAYDAIEPAKKAHQVAHNAAAKLTEDVQAQIDAIKLKKNELGCILNMLDNIISAYYSNQAYYYVDSAGTLKEIYPTDANNLKIAIKNAMAEFEGADGSIKDAEEQIETLQKTLDRYLADEEFDNVAQAQLELEKAKQKLEYAQQYYDIVFAQLQAYIAALGLE